MKSLIESFVSVTQNNQYRPTIYGYCERNNIISVRFQYTYNGRVVKKMSTYNSNDSVNSIVVDILQQIQ